MARPDRTAAALSTLLLTLGLSHCHSPSNPTQHPCEYTVAPAAISAPAAGGQVAVTVTTTAACSWTGAADREWITVDRTAGTGSGVVTVTVAANTGTEARAGTATIGGRAIPVEQAGQPACELTVSPVALNLAPDEATGTLAVTTQAYCTWTASTNTGWIRLMNGQSGQGSGVITYLVERNPATIARSGAIAVNAVAIAVHQDGDLGLCTYAVAPVEFSPCLTPLTFTAALDTQDACPWTASPTVPWLSLDSAGAGTGPASISIQVASNFDAPRHGVIEVRWPTPTEGQNIHIQQAGCRYGVSTSALAIGAGGGTLQFDVYQQTEPNACGGPLQDACVWTAVPDAPWLTMVTAMPVRGDGRVTLSVAPNPGGLRTATVTIKDRVVVVTQAGASPSRR